MDQEFETVWQRMTYTMMHMLNGCDSNLNALLHSKNLLSVEEYERGEST